MGFVEEGDETREAGPNFWMGFYLPECSSSSGVCVGGRRDHRPGVEVRGAHVPGLIDAGCHILFRKKKAVIGELEV